MQDSGMLLAAFILIGFGIVYLLKPDIYQQWPWLWPWKRRDLVQRLLTPEFTPERYKAFVRVLGGLFLVAGIVLLIFSQEIK